MKAKTFLFIIIVFNSLAIFAQNIECNSDQIFIGLHKNQTYKAPCDSMVVLTGKTYFRLVVENKKCNTELTLCNKQVELLNKQVEVSDSLINALKKDISTLETAMQQKDNLLNECTILVKESTDNTQKCINKKKLCKILGISGTVAGFIVGILL